MRKKSLEASNGKKPEIETEKDREFLKEEIKTVDSGINDDGVFIFGSLMTPLEFSQKLKKTPQEIIKYFFMKGIAINLNTLMTKDQMGEYCLECGYDFK